MRSIKISLLFAALLLNTAYDCQAQENRFGSISSFRTPLVNYFHLNDFTGDQLTDVLEMRDDRLIVWTNSGNGSFVPSAESFLDGVWLNLSYDVDNDNDVDLIARSSDAVTILQNNGSNEFQAAQVINVESYRVELGAI